jgi:cobalt-zinc-cadmium efflux system protein
MTDSEKKQCNHDHHHPHKDDHEDDHDHSHHHGHHDGHHHGHHHPIDSGSSRKVLIVFCLTFTFMLLEYWGGVITNSLALISDATHMLTDSAALALTLWSLHLAKKPASAKNTFGLYRSEVLGAFTNGIFLIIISGAILWEAFQRFQSPEMVDAQTMLWISTAGLAVNLVAGAILFKSSHSNLAIKGAVFHIAGDALGSVGAIVAAVLILWKGWILADPIISVVVAILIFSTALNFIRETSHLILQGVPHNKDLREIENRLLQIAGV